MTFTFFCNAAIESDIYILRLTEYHLFTYYNVDPNWTYRDGSKFPYEYFKRR